MAQHLRLEAILTVPPSLPLTLIITVFQPNSLKMSSSREDVVVVVVFKNIWACKAQLEECGYLHSCRMQAENKSVNQFVGNDAQGFSENECRASEHLVAIRCLLNDPGGLNSTQDKTTKPL